MMQDKDILVVKPSHILRLEGPFNKFLKSQIEVHNPSQSRWVTFKVKTTSPKVFYLRPNMGIVEPNETAYIELFLQPESEELNSRNHKLLIQSTAVTSDICDVREFWKSVNPEDICNTKLKVELKAAEDAVQNSVETVVQKGDSVGVDEAPPVAQFLEQIKEVEAERGIKQEEGKKVARDSVGRKIKKYMMFFILTVLVACAAIYIMDKYK